jgi:hypothetical protein
MRTQVAALAGHRDMKITLRYAHLTPSHLLDGIQALEPRSPRPGLGPITVQDLTRPTWEVQKASGLPFTAHIEQPSSIQLIPPSSLVFPLLEEYPCWSTCGRHTKPFSGRAFREHGSLRRPYHLFL